jgi:hypothetical protein
LTWPKDPYEVVNSIIIYLTVGFLGILVVLTSGPNFSLFGQNQLLVLGIITLLLLFRYIKKIKIGNILEIEFNDLQTHHKNIMTKLQPMVDTLNAGNAITTLVTPEADLNYIRDELLKAQGNIETIKARASAG